VKRKKAAKGACGQRLAAVKVDRSGIQKRTYENYRSRFSYSNRRTVPLDGPLADV
jgi:hypothetical protein